MFDQRLYDFNLKLLASIDPTLAAKVDELKAAVIPESSRKEVEEWYSHLELGGIAVLYVYGIGSGDAYEIVKPWLKENLSRFVVFLEDDLTHLKQMLGTTKATPLLLDLQVDIRDISRATIERRVIRSITEDNMLRPTAITTLPSYQKEKYDHYALIRDLILSETSAQTNLFRELANFGYEYYKNFFPNLLELPQAYDGQKLANKFKNVPAIICGAGPSLYKQIPLLKTLSGKALIFASSSASSALTFQGVWPHFSVVVDPTVTSFQQQYMQRGYETPTFYHNRVFNETLRTIHGPKLFLPDESFYTVEKWFEEQLNLSPLKIVEGHSSVSSALVIAKELGCNPIIFIGVELSKSSAAHYAPGVERHPLYPFNQDSKPELGAPIEAKDIFGNVVTSHWPWVSEAQWIDVYNRLNPGLSLINSTEAGIGLFSVPNIPLAEVAEKYLPKAYDLDALVHRTIQEAAPMPVTITQVKDSLENFLQSIKRCLETCRQIDQSITADPDNRSKLENILKKEAGYQYLLIQLEEFFLKFIQKDLRNISRIPQLKERNRKKQYLDHMLYRYLMQALDVNMKIITVALNKSQPQGERTAAKAVTAPAHDASKKVYRYPSGAIYSIGSYEDGQRDGVHLYYFPHGTLKSEIHYKQGLLHGPARLYYPDGKLQREMYFHAGLRDGMESSWYENGQKFTQVEYQHNLAKHALAWRMDGTVAKDITITHAKEVSNKP